MNIKRFIILTFFSFITQLVNAQTGLNFQGVARSSNNIILASQSISLRLSILQGSANGIVEYVEVRKVNTNAQGLFSVVIGDEEATNTIGNISNINWKNTPKFLKIEIDAAAGNNFTIVGITQFQYVAYAQFAKSVDAEKIIGILPVSKGGTGLSSISDLKSVLALDKINNTSDLDKPISTKTQAALDLISSTIIDTTLFLKRINSKVDTSDLSIITSLLVTKLNVADTIKYTKQAYADSSLLSKLKITDTSNMLSNRIARDTLNLSKRINLKANITDHTLSLELKENISNKSSASDLGGTSPSDLLYPTQKAVKDYITANNAAGSISDGSITSIKLADAAVNFQKLQIIPPNTILGNTTSNPAILQAITTTGTDNVVLSTSPTLVSPNLGEATATSINNVTINALNGNASLTVRGDVILRGMNNGDDAPNQRYENILSDGIVSLTANQPIDGQKTFQNNIVMGNIEGISNTHSPTTIQFSNGSQIGDIQNINEANPDINGSIDLYAPDGAKWVQLNYANRNYITLSNDYIGTWINDKEWKFDEYGITTLPNDVFTGGDIYFSNDGITNLPNASIESNGPYLKIKSRLYTPEEKEDVDYGIELNYADKTKLEMDDFGLEFWTDSEGDGITSYFSIDNKNFIFSTRETTSKFLSWKFDGETAKTTLPGNLEVDGDLKLGEVIYTKEGGTSGDILTYDGNGHAVWQAPNGSASLNFDLPLLNLNNSISIPAATVSVNGYLSSVDFNTFNNKQDALINPLTGTGTSGQLSFFNGTSSITSSCELFWDASKNSLGIGIIPNSAFQKFDFISGAPNKNSLLIAAPNGDGAGSQIGFLSNNGNDTNAGLFQLDGVGNMVFRTIQYNLSFDNFGEGDIEFRVGKIVGNGFNFTTPFKIKADQSINFYSNVNISSGTLSVTGNVYVDGTVSSAGTVLTSDIRLKNNIIPLKNSLNLINQLNPVSYNKRNSLSSNHYFISENGFIAQELQKILPDLVHESSDKNKLLSVNYTAIIPILTKGIQEQQLEIEELKRELQELKKLIQTMNKRK